MFFNPFVCTNFLRLDQQYFEIDYCIRSNWSLFSLAIISLMVKLNCKKSTPKHWSFPIAKGRRILIERSNGRQKSEMEGWPKNQTQLQLQPIECECVLRSRLLLLICFLAHHTDHNFCLWIIERLIFLFKIIRKLLSESLLPSLYRHLPKDACLFINLSGMWMHKCFFLFLPFFFIDGIQLNTRILVLLCFFYTVIG